MKTFILSNKNKEEYERLLLEDENTLILSTLKYRSLLEWITECEPYYIVAYENDKMVGCLPTFLKRNQKYGNVLNSLPWYGSNPGITLSLCCNKTDVIDGLIKSFHRLALEHNCISSTLVNRPFEDDMNFIGYDFLDKRIGMFTHLPVFDNDIDKKLMDIIHSKTRNLIRKAQKVGITSYHSNSIDDLMFLAETHKRNMETVGAPVKDRDFFMKLSDIFEYDKDYRVYIAELDGVKIGGLLLLYFNKTVEYFTPAIDVKYRSYQPLNHLIFNSMKDMSEKGFKYWNWGGTTLPGMEGVYHYKKRWGSHECVYHYYTTFYRDLHIIRQTSSDVLLKEYPHFYVIPFSKLEDIK